MQKTDKMLFHVLKGMAILLGSAALIFWGLYAAGKFQVSDADLAKTYRERWSLSLPDSLQRQYYVSSFGWMGEGSDFAVYRTRPRYVFYRRNVFPEKRGHAAADFAEAERSHRQ